MGREIERKFLVRDRSIVEGLTGRRIVQGYLANGLTSVRVRLDGEHARIAIKGPMRQRERAEYEYDIPPDDAAGIFALCELPPIRKTRYIVRCAQHDWEIDVFEGANAPLVVAEVELGSADEPVLIPSWAGAEVTDDPRYANARLAERPYGGWPVEER